jgi:hypothetical protein
MVEWDKRSTEELEQLKENYTNVITNNSYALSPATVGLVSRAIINVTRVLNNRKQGGK